MLHSAVVLVVVVCLLQSTVFVVAAETEQTTASATTNTSNATVAFTDAREMTDKQRDSVITIEFRPTVTSGANVTSLSDEQIRRLRQVILDELNRQIRQRQRQRRTTTTVAETTADTTTTKLAVTSAAVTTAAVETTTTQTTETPTTVHKVASHDYFLLLRRRRDVDLDFDDDYYFDVDEENQSPEDSVGQSSAEVARRESNRARRAAATVDPSLYYSSGYYTEDDLQFILVEPVVVDGVVRIAVALDKPGETNVDPNLLQSAAEAVRDNGQLAGAAGMPVERIYRGLPQDSQPDPAARVVPSAAELNWQFLVAFFVIFVCFIIILLAVMCVRRRRRQVPTPIEEDTLLPAAAPMHEQQRPGDLYNDVGTPISNGRKNAPAGHHDDDGYIVPYDVMLGVLAHSYDGPQAPSESTKL